VRLTLENDSLTGEVIILDATMPMILPQGVARPLERLALEKGTLTGQTKEKVPMSTIPQQGTASSNKGGIREDTPDNKSSLPSYSAVTLQA
jgi:hypothetical protein